MCIPEASTPAFAGDKSFMAQNVFIQWVFYTSFTAASQISDRMNYVSAGAAPNVLILSGVHTHRFAHKHKQRTAGKAAHHNIWWVGPSC